MLELLGSVAGGLAPAIGGIFGAGFRLWAEYQARQAKKDEMAHDLAMLKAQAEIEDRRSEQRQAEISRASEAQLAAIRASGEQATNLAELNAMAAAVQAQAQPTGIPWVDAANAAVRPIITYWWCLVLYTAYKALLVIALFSGPTTPEAAVVARVLMTDFDFATIGSILGFWFVDRALRKAAGR